MGVPLVVVYLALRIDFFNQLIVVIKVAFGFTVGVGFMRESILVVVTEAQGLAAGVFDPGR